MQEDGFLKSENGDFYWLQNRVFYHLPSDFYKQRVKRERSILLIFLAVAGYYAFTLMKLIELNGLKQMAIILVCLGLYIAYRLGGMLIVRHLDQAGKQRWIEYQQNKAKLYHPALLIGCSIFFFTCSFYFASFIPSLYENYTYYQAKIAPSEPAPAIQPQAKPQEPSPEYRQWVEDNNITPEQLNVAGKIFYDDAQQQKRHDIIMARDTLYSLILAPVLPLCLLGMGALTAFWARLSWRDHKRLSGGLRRQG